MKVHEERLHILFHRRQFINSEFVETINSSHQNYIILRYIYGSFQEFPFYHSITMIKVGERVFCSSSFLNYIHTRYSIRSSNPHHVVTIFGYCLYTIVYQTVFHIKHPDLFILRIPDYQTILCGKPNQITAIYIQIGIMMKIVEILPGLFIFKHRCRQNLLFIIIGKQS